MYAPIFQEVTNKYLTYSPPLSALIIYFKRLIFVFFSISFCFAIYQLVSGSDSLFGSLAIL